jgi:iron complex outermembrane receptor protein
MPSSSIFRAITIALVVTLLAAPTPGGAHERSHDRDLRGVVRSADTGQPLAGTAVTLVGSTRTVITHADGQFHIHVSGSPPWLLRIERLGYRSLDLEVGEGSATPLLTVALEPAAVDIAGLVVTGALTERGADEALHPVDVLTGEELQRRLRETLAATLAAEPGVSATSMGPATARPVIRGLSGDRVLVLEDGMRVGDVSSSGADHATATDGAGARRVEVLRGPAALLYGGNALGGVVNIIRDEIPTDEVHHLHGTATLQGRTVNGGVMGSVSALMPLSERVPLRVELSGRTGGDLSTPLGTLENTQLESLSAGAGSSLFTGWGSAGGAFRYYRNHYGIPGGFVGGHAEGVRVEMERTSTRARLAVEQPVGPFRTLQADAAYTWYRHTEIEPPDIVGTFFKRQVVSTEVVGRHDGITPVSSGAVGLRGAWERHGFAGSLSTPDTHLSTLGLFALEEAELGPVTLEAGLRWDWARADPVQKDPDSDIGDVRTRTFQAASGSFGALWRVADGVALGGSVARAFRIPDVGELYSEGPHLAAYIFEVGNPDLSTEVGTGLDAFVRLGGERLRAEVSAFHNRISGYIYPRETGDTSRVRLPIFQFSGEDATLTGFEGQVEWSPGGGLVLSGSTSYVRGTLSDDGLPLPLIPPLQARMAAEYTEPAWFLRVEGVAADRQGRVGEFEAPTAGYTLLNLSAGVRRTFGGRLHALTVTLDNATDRIYRNHLSRVKEIMPEAGRGLTATYRVAF